MDLFGKDEPLINLGGSSAEDQDEQPPQRLRNRSNEKTHNNSNRHRFSSAYLRELSPTKRDFDVHLGVDRSIIVSSVERAMKSYADGVLRVLEGTSSRLAHVERATQDLKQSIAALKISVDDYFDQTNGNYGKLNERVMEIQRSVQILRDKQDIIEAHAQLTKLQITGKGSVAESGETVKPQQLQDLSPQLQSQQQLQMQQSLQVPASTQPLGTLVKLAPLQQEAVQYVQQEGPLQIIQQVPNSSLSSDQVQYQVIPQKMQTQISAVQQMPNQQPFQVTTQHTVPIQQSIEQVRIVTSPQQMQQPVQQQPSQVVLQHPASIQQPIDQVRMQSAPQQLQASMQITQQPPGQQLVQQSTMLQQPYAQGNEGQGYTSAIPAVQSGQIAQNAYATETSYGYAPHPQSFPINQPLSPANFNYQQQSAMLQQPVPHVQQTNAAEPMFWNRQQPNFPVQTPPSRLQTARPVHPDRPSDDINGIIDKVAAMGFSRNQVQSVVRHLLEKEQSIDMNVVLDILMNGNQRR